MASHQFWHNFHIFAFFDGLNAILVYTQQGELLSKLNDVTVTIKVKRLIKFVYYLIV